jgi:hypothetical protein
MARVYEIAFRGDQTRANHLREWFDRTVAKTWTRLPGLSALDTYSPIDDSAHDPFNADTGGPLLIVIADFAEPEAHAAARSNLESELALLPAGVGVTVSALERRFYAVADDASPRALHAPFSYVVRYHRPAEDESAFVANYVATHPPTLAKLPRIRSIMCYFPLAASAVHRHAVADYMIGNEVVFDSVADFNAAMQSPVRRELREHFNAFPSFTGRVTHYPMRRTRLAG